MVKYLGILLTLVIILSGCTTTPQVATMYPLPPSRKHGVYHRVSKGETLWRIAKSYNVEISKIAQINKLRDPSRITTGQMLFIPGAEKKQNVPTKIATHVSKEGFIWPVRGKIVSYFGQKRHDTVNDGIDILSHKDALVVASKSGIVSFCDDRVKGFGKTIIIDHGDGHSTVYAYNSKNLVKPGYKVKKGEAIAKVGKSSRSGKHTLHFEIRKRQKPKNPFYYLP